MEDGDKVPVNTFIHATRARLCFDATLHLIKTIADLLVCNFRYSMHIFGQLDIVNRSTAAG